MKDSNHSLILVLILFSDFDGIVVMAIGDRNDISKIKEAPDNFIIAPYVPQSEILNEADVFYYTWWYE